jgi:hypothetical protein
VAPGLRRRAAWVTLIACLVLCLLLAACSGGGTLPASTSTSIVPVSTTPTTDPGADCRRLAADAVEYLEDVVAALEGVSVSELADRSRWPDVLVELEQRGEEMDERAAELGCDPGAVQQEVVLRAATLEARGPIARLLLDLLLGRAG